MSEREYLTTVSCVEVAEIIITLGGEGCADEAEALASGKCQVVAASVSSYDDTNNDNTCPTK